MSQQYHYNNRSTGSQGGGSGGGFGFGGLLLIVAICFGVYNNQRGIIPTNDLNEPFIYESSGVNKKQTSNQELSDSDKSIQSWEGYTGGIVTYKVSDNLIDLDLPVDINYEPLIESLHKESIRMADETGNEAVEQVPQTQDIYFRNCQEAVDSGLAPLHKGELGYREALDTNKDGVACEE